jgi:methionine synthase II (cobalamin-independent)
VSSTNTPHKSSGLTRIAALIREALHQIPHERLMISPDCGMGAKA